jgi:serine/threonine-protein kinase
MSNPPPTKLEESGPHPGADLIQALLNDQAKRWKAGDRVPAEFYLEGHPALREHPEYAVDLIYGEFLLREQQGETPDFDEYAQRFPAHAAVLRDQISLHQAMALRSECAGASPLTGAPPGELTGPYSRPIGASQSSDAPGPTAPAIDQARFTPGQLLGQRYRIVALLGKGGMGEVYRADDLKLGQSVALKFLPATLAQQPDRLARLHQEVRVAREVSHPNVCRVYDIAEADGQPFLTMEYIDGENLASLLRRIGRVPEDKGIELARQLCLGLSAAHEKGVLHRDLKPHNIMLDGRGQVRVADFGLAGYVDRVLAEELGAGTPAYMAPEQLAGKEVSVQSDLFALGLILYELFTGRRAFPAETPEELQRLHEAGPPSKPSSVVHGLNHAVERVILRCLEKAPPDRPRSAYEVLAALPRDDPLRAALAAGETPSPRLVAEGGEVGSLRPRVGVFLLALVIAGLVFIAVLNDRAALFRLVPLTEPPEELARQARRLLAELGYQDRPADSASHFRVALDYVDYVNRTDLSPDRWQALGLGRPAAMYLFYRESPELLVPGLGADDPEILLAPQLVSPHNPPPTQPGMASVRLDGQGRLLELVVIPTTGGGRTETPANWWKPLLAAAGLRDDLRTTSTFQWVPPTACDQRTAWDGAFTERPDLAVHVEAASFQGRPVFFRVGGVWTGSEATPVTRPSASTRLFLAMLLVGTLGVVLLGLRNIQRGRADRRGALVLGGFLLIGTLVAWLLGGHHPGTIVGELLGIYGAFGIGGWWGLVAALAYLALEPAIRRRWPWRLTAWTRALRGQLRDPLVGRDLLIGILGGIGMFLIWRSNFAVLRPLNLPPPLPLQDPWDVLAAPAPLLYLLQCLLAGAFLAIFQFALAFLLALVLRRQSLGWVAFVVLFTLGNTLGVTPLSMGGTLATVLSNVLLCVLAVILMSRFGLWTYTAAFTTFYSLFPVPLTWDVSAWYFPQGLLCAGVAVALAVYGFVTACGGRQLLQGFLGDE